MHKYQIAGAVIIVGGICAWGVNTMWGISLHDGIVVILGSIYEVIREAIDHAKSMMSDGRLPWSH